MIVSCPACRIRYRYLEPVPETGAQAVCSGCEGLVPLVAARQAYVVRAQVVAVPAGVPVGAAAGSGMGHSGLASSLATGDGPASSFGVMASEPASVPAQPDSPFDQPAVPLRQGVPQAQPADGFELESASPEDAQPASAAREAAPSDRPAGPKGRGVVRRVLQLLAVVILVAAGAAAGEYATMVGWLGPVSVHSAVEPVRLGIIGALLGVLVAWAGIRWTTPKS